MCLSSENRVLNSLKYNNWRIEHNFNAVIPAKAGIHFVCVRTSVLDASKFAVSD